MRTIFDQLRFHAACNPMKAAIMLPDRIVTYEMLLKGIRSVQTVLADLTLDRDRPVGILIDGPSRHIIVVLALLKSGFTFVSMRSEHIELALDCGVTAIITDEKLPVLPSVRTFSVEDKWFVSSSGSRDPEFRFPPDRIARIQFTSGSSGLPKAIGWTFRTLHSRIFEAYMSGIGSHSRFLTTQGLSNVALRFALRVFSDGNTIVFSPLVDVLQTMSIFEVTELRTSVSQARSLLEMQAVHRYPVRIEKFDIGGLLSVEAAADIAKTFKSNVINTYSSTEAGHAGIAAGEVLRLRRTKGNCFVPIARVEIISDADAPLPVGREGRVRVRTQNMGWPFKGNLIETDEVKGDGWFYPGDLGLVDPDGFLIVTGRYDEVINEGGVKFAPEVMESHLNRHPKIQDVAILRMPTVLGQAEPWLAVVAKDSISLELIQQWMGQNITGELGSVRLARLFIIDSIPRTGTGKVARQELRNLLRGKS